MVAPSDHIFFPPLQECLKGEKILLSWKFIATSLADPQSGCLSSRSVSTFLRDSFVASLFQDPSRAFAAPTTSTKSDFETKTAAINITPTPSDQFDLDVIKSDALWLSKNAALSEAAALRIVVIEFQARAESHLAGPLSAQDAVNIQDAVGSNCTHGADALSALVLANPVDAETIWADFEKEENRRQRLFATYLSERRHFATAADHMVTRLLQIEGMTDEQQSANGHLRREAMLEAAPTYLDYLQGCMTRSVEGLDSVLQEIKYLTKALAADWLRTSLVEAVHVMILIFQVLDHPSRGFAVPSTVSQWFTFAAEFGFLDGLGAMEDDVPELVLPLKCLVCAISMVLLSVSRSLDFLNQELELGENEQTYLQDNDVLLQIHTALVGAVDGNITASAPVVFSWSLLVHSMHVAYQERLERRDLAQNQRAQAGFELEHQPPVSAPPFLASTGRRNSAGSIISIEARGYDNFLAQSLILQDSQIAEKLGRAATSGGMVYDVLAEFAMCAGSGSGLGAGLGPGVGVRVRSVFLDLLKASFPLVGYQSEPVGCFLTILSADPDSTEDSTTGLRASPVGDSPSGEQLVDLVLEDPLLLEYYVDQALNRYLYEYIPFTTVCRLLSTRLGSDDVSERISASLLKTPSLTITLPDGFQAYQLIQEDENTNSIELLQDIALFESSSSWRRQLRGDEDSFYIPAGSSAKFVTDSGGVVLVNYEHSALGLMGKRLEVYSVPDSYRSVLGLLRPDEVAETISLLTSVTRGETRRALARGRDRLSDGEEAGLAVLKEASRGVTRTKDIVAIVCDILDNGIQDDLMGSDAAEVAVLRACIDFLHVVLPICPGRIWAYVARCELLNTESRAGRLSRATGGSELTNDRFEFLDSTVRFLAALVENAMQSSVHRKASVAKHAKQAKQAIQTPQAANGHGRQMEKSGSKGSEGLGLWAGTSDKVLSRVAVSVAQTAIDVFENTSTWKYASDMHQSILVRDLVLIMNNLVVYTYSFGGSGECLTECLAPAAGYILDCFLSSSSASLRFQPLLSTLLSALRLQTQPGCESEGLYPQRSGILSGRLTAVLEFSTSLVKAATFLDKPTTTIETQLFKTASILARLCVISDRFRAPTFGLLEALVGSLDSRATAEPPSLLGYLGPQISRSFLKVFSRLDKPFDRPQEGARLWKLVATIIRSRQRWMASCLLTGSIPRDAFKGEGTSRRSGQSGNSSRVSPDSALVVARNRLREISSLSSSEALAILDFFTAAQNHWPWTIFATRGDTAYLQDLRKYVRGLRPASLSAKTDPAEVANQARIAAYIAETFAMHLYHLRQMGQEKTFSQDLLQDLDYLLREGVEVSGYNHSLHANFARNFASRYSGVPLEAFKRTLFAPRELGKQYYYELDLAQKMLGFDTGWVGPRESGFRNEMETANLNLSLVDGQIALFHAWEFLLLELGVCLLPNNKPIAVVMLQVAEQCLTANQATQGPDQIFLNLRRARANLALMLVQRLAENSSLPGDLSPLLATLWATINSISNPFDLDQMDYYRTLLKVLYVVLRGCRHGRAEGSVQPVQPMSSVSATQTVLNILDHVVAQGFRTLVGLIHDPDTTVSPEDVVLVTAILQACLAVPGIDECQMQVLNIMASQDVLHVAMSLFSWSDRLAEKGDPIYGELSLLFLLELSAVPSIAEQLALDGLLGHLTSAKLASLMRRPNVSPFASTAVAQRCYSIWNRAVLPLLLNILGSLGASIAPEVAFVLNLFPNLLEASVQRFEAPGMSRTASRDAGRHMTFLAASEVHSLALLTRVLSALRLANNRDIPEVQWDAASLLENVEFWLSRPNLLRESLLPLGNREVEWRAKRMDDNREAVGAAGDKEGGGVRTETVLEEKVVSLLDSVKMILSEEVE